MKIVYSPLYCGSYYMNMPSNHVTLDVQVLETQGLLSQLALHAGIHQQTPSFPERLTSYHKALMEYDKSHGDNIFHRSVQIDSMSVAKTLLHWRDYLALCGWNQQTKLQDCSRLNTLAEIDSYYHDDGLAVLLQKLSSQIKLMEFGTIAVPQTLKSLTIEIPSALGLMPDYIQPLLQSLQRIGTTIVENADETTAKPETITEIHFSQQWQAEAWLSQQDPNSYDLWVNTDNKRLDNWLHMSGQPLCGSQMTDSNPQITQLFLLAVQLFQRPLNVNTLLQYLLLSECPLDWQLRKALVKTITREGGFCNEEVQYCINNFIYNDPINRKDPKDMNEDEWERCMDYIAGLPYDLYNEDLTLPLVEESDVIEKRRLKLFLEFISHRMTHRVQVITQKNPYDARIAQLKRVSEMADALLSMIDTIDNEELSFTQISQWAQALYESSNYTLYNAQINSRRMIQQPANMIDKADNTIWCDFYGDVSHALSTDFLSNHEQEQLKTHGVHLWDKQHESDLQNMLLARPVYKTKKNLTIVTCEQQGATKLSMHPLYLQLPYQPEPINGDELYAQMATKEIQYVDNHREEDDREITFDAKNHPVSWRSVESYSALEKLLQNPFDYFMNYTLHFTDINDNEIKPSTTYGNVAHDVIEYLFTAERDGMQLKDFVNTNYDEAFNRALARKGALLLLPEHHLAKARLHYQLRSCISKLADIIQENKLTVISCEQEEKQDLGLEGGILVQGFIDMLLCDKNGNDVVFDLKWTSRKDKHKKILEKNRALQLAIYEAMLMKHTNPSQTVRTAFFVMPAGTLFSKDDFLGSNYEKVPSADADVIIDQLCNGHAERVREINEGRIETADSIPLNELDYTRVENVFPLEDDEKKKDPKKIENKYSDYKCFTI